MKKNLLKKIIFPISVLCLSALNGNAQMSVTTGNTAEELALRLAGEGVEVFNATLNDGCALQARGTFGFPEGLSDLGIDSGIVLTTGAVSTATSGIHMGYETDMAVASPSSSSDPDLASLVTVSINDACVLEFDFIPAGDTIKFNYVFASEEYNEYACTNFNDVFGFFISRGSYTTPTNIALIPGTTIPVAINTINNAPQPNRFGGFYGTVSTCTGLGAGVPYSSLYIDNENVLLSPNVSYDGFTTVLQAVAAVNPCDTFHLKIAIGDGSDQTLDSGVFLEAGSMRSTAITVETFGGAGLEVPFTNTVRGCPPGYFTVSRNGSTGSAITIEYELEGTAENGVDYETLPGSVVIPAGEYSVDVPIVPLILPEAVGPKTVIVNIMSPYVCPGEEPIVLSTDTITIFDSLYVNIVQPDTAICLGDVLNLQVEADSLVNLVWSPVGGIMPDEFAREISVSPTSSTTYKATVWMDGVACPAASDQILVTVKTLPDVSFTGDVIMCLDGSVELNPIITPEPDSDYTYQWTPAAGLDNPNVRYPNASPSVSTYYVLETNPGAVGCSSFDTVFVQILPNSINLLNSDTIVCEGSVVPLNVDGHTAFNYYWTPETYIDNPHVRNTAITATESGNVTVTASYPGCYDMIRTFYLEVQPNPIVNLGDDIVLCAGDTAHMYAGITSEYPNYNYAWMPGMKLTDSTIKDPIFTGFSSQEYEVAVTTPLGCIGRDTVLVTVNASDFANVNIVDTNMCPPIGNIQLEATGGVEYKWYPSYGLSNDSIPNPIASPDYSTEYMLIVKSDKECFDTIMVNMNVSSSAVISLPDSVHIWPGESYEMDISSNAHYFSWYPPEGLSSNNIANPVASPDVRTRYYVTATTEYGCTAIDSIDVVVHLESIFDVPNAFAPGNSYSNNGKFMPVRRGEVTLTKFEIYNRWGNKVYSSSNINEGWDGTFDGQPQPMGVYVYMIEAELNNGRKITQTGNVTLVR